MEQGFTVKELIEELQSYEDDQKVWMTTGDGRYIPVDRIDRIELINDNDITLR